MDNSLFKTLIVILSWLALPAVLVWAHEKWIGRPGRPVDAQGKPAKRLVPPNKVVPGNEIIWTITATNTCAKAAEKVVVENNVPEHMVYVADSAMGAGTDIAFSLNGRDYAKLGDLKVRDADGSTRAPRADEIKSIRWVYGSAFAANATGFVRYRAKVESSASPEAVALLLRQTDAVAEVHNTLRSGVPVELVP